MIAHPTFTGLVGLARTDITPPVGIFCRNWGAAMHDTAQGIHRPLFLTALAIRDSSAAPPLVLLDTDLGWWASLAYERESNQEASETYRDRARQMTLADWYPEADMKAWLRSEPDTQRLVFP